MFNMKRHITMMHSPSVEEGVTDQEKEGENVSTGGENVSTEGENVSTGGENVSTGGENVSTFSCPTCYKTFLTRKYMNRHVPGCKRVKNPLECEKCHRVFKSRGGLSKHRWRCEDTYGSVEVCPTSCVEGITNIVTNNNNFNNTINVAGNVIQHNNNTININNFGQENKEYIAIEFIRQCLSQGSYGISPMIDKIYFDPEHPENHNVSLESFKNRLVKVVQENKWQLSSLLNTVDSMISKASNFIISTLAQEIIEKVEEDTLTNVHAIQSIEPNMKKRIREHTKGRLARRRENRLCH
jgi:uncharacterized C2H2 Zn-finger protein